MTKTYNYGFIINGIHNPILNIDHNKKTPYRFWTRAKARELANQVTNLHGYDTTINKRYLIKPYIVEILNTEQNNYNAKQRRYQYVLQKLIDLIDHNHELNNQLSNLTNAQLKDLNLITKRDYENQLLNWQDCYYANQDKFQAISADQITINWAAIKQAYHNITNTYDNYLQIDYSWLISDNQVNGQELYVAQPINPDTLIYKINQQLKRINHNLQTIE